MKKLISLLLVAVMVLSFGLVNASAEEPVTIICYTNDNANNAPTDSCSRGCGHHQRLYLCQFHQAWRYQKRTPSGTVMQNRFRCWVSYSNGFCFRNMIPCSFDYLIYPYYPAYTMGCYQIVISNDNGSKGFAICSAGLRL